MSTFLSDRYDSAGGENLVGHVPNIGAAWVSHPHWAAGAGYIGAGNGFVTGGSGVWTARAPTAPGDGFGQYDLDCITVDGGGDGVALVGGRFTTADTGYIVMGRENFGSNDVRIERYDAGVYDGAKSTGVSYTAWSTRKVLSIKFEDLGGGSLKIAALVDGVEVASVTDTSPIAGPGYAIIGARNARLHDLVANDTTSSAPVITGPSGAATGNTTGSGSASTTGADGTLWRKAATSAQTDPGAGNESANGWSSTTVAGSGAQNVTFTGLTTNTSHVANYLHVSAGGLRSSVATSATFAPPTMASSGSLSAQSGVISSAFAWTGVTPESQIIQQGVGSSAWALTSAGGSGLTTINSSTGVPGGTLTATPGTYTVTVTKTDSSTAGTNPTGGGAPPQTIVRSITITVSAGADTTPPTLSSASAAGGVATCSGSVSTNEGNGTLYTVFCASATPPTALQVEAGQDNTGAAALRAVSQAVSLSGAQTVPAGAISAGTRYAYFMHKDAAGNRSSVVASASITVTAGGVGSFNLNNAIYAFKRKDGVLLASLGATFFVNNHLTGELIGAAITGLSTNASGIVTTPVSNASVVAGTTYRLSWRFSSGEYGQIEMQAA